MDVDLAKFSALTWPGVFCHAYFTHKNSEACRLAERLGQCASHFVEAEDAGELVRLVGFAQHERDAQLCHLFLSTLKEVPGHVVFIRGRPERVTWRLINVVECFARALAAGDGYCSVESTSSSVPFRGRATSPYTQILEQIGPAGDDSRFVCPCRELAPFLMLSKKMGLSAVEQIRATAIEKKQACCPLFNADGYREILPAPVKYW